MTTIVMPYVSLSDARKLVKWWNANSEYYHFYKKGNDRMFNVVRQENKKLENDRLIECHRQPTLYEIKFGEGAVHYRSFTAYEIGYNKKGELKKVFKAKDDGLYYSRY